MTSITLPTGREIRDAWREETEDFVEVHEDADPSYRHGCYMTTVFRRVSDDTYWAAHYTVTGDGEYNKLRDDPDSVSIIQVQPVQVTTTMYRPVKRTLPQ